MGYYDMEEPTYTVDVLGTQYQVYANAPVEEDDLLERVSSRDAVRRVCEAVDQCLTGQERKVILMRYGLAGHSPMRQREVAEVTGISRSYVSRIEKRALQKLREVLES